MLGKLNSNEIDSVLRKEVVGRIGCSANGCMYIVPVYYAYDGNSVYIASREGNKVDIMRKNSTVCFEVEHIENMANWKSVLLHGEYEEIIKEEDRKKALQIIHERQIPLVSGEMAHLSIYWPFVERDINSIKRVIYKISIRERTGRFEQSDFVE